MELSWEEKNAHEEEVKVIISQSLEDLLSC